MITQANVDGRTVPLDASLRILSQGHVLHDPARLQKEMAMSRMFLSMQGTTTWYTRELTAALFNTVDWSPVMRWLQECEQAGPIVEIRKSGEAISTGDDEALRALTTEQIRKEELDPCFLPQPAVEAFIRSLVNEITKKLFLNTNAYKFRNAAEVAQLTFSTAANIHFALGIGWAGARGKENISLHGILAECIHAVRLAIMTTYSLQTLSHCGKDRPDFMQKYSTEVLTIQQGFSSRIDRTQCDKEPMATAFLSVTDTTVFAEKNLHPMFSAFNGRVQCSDFEKRLAAGAPAEKSETVPHSPLGIRNRVSLIHPYGSGKDVLWYTEDDLRHAREADLYDASVKLDPPTTEDAYKIHHPVGNSCKVDAAGKIYFGVTDRLAPSIPGADYDKFKKTFDPVHSAAHGELAELQKRFDTLFAFAEDLGPYFFFRRAAGDIVLVTQKTSTEMLGEILHAEPLTEEELVEYLKTFGTNANTIVGYALEGPLFRPLPEKKDDSAASHDEEETADEDEDEEEEESDAETESSVGTASTAPVAKPNKAHSYNKRLRAIFGRDSVPSLEWLIEHMKPFGTLWDETSNVGSEGWLYLQKPGGGKPLRFRTWHTLRNEVESPGWKMLYWVLRKFDIPAEEFCDVWAEKLKK